MLAIELINFNVLTTIFSFIQLWINTSSNTVTSFEGWKNGTYFVYHPDVTITWNMFNDMPMYRAIAEYLLDHY